MAMTVAGFALLAVGVVVHSSGVGAGVELKQVSLSAWACAAGRLRRPCLPWHPCMATTAQIIPAALEVVAAKACFVSHLTERGGGAKALAAPLSEGASGGEEIVQDGSKLTRSLLCPPGLIGGAFQVSVRIAASRSRKAPRRRGQGQGPGDPPCDNLTPSAASQDCGCSRLCWRDSPRVFCRVPPSDPLPRRLANRQWVAFRRVPAAAAAAAARRA